MQQRFGDNVVETVPIGAIGGLAGVDWRFPIVTARSESSRGGLYTRSGVKIGFWMSVVKLLDRGPWTW